MIRIPEGLEGKELFAFLKANKSALIKQKSAFPKTSDAVDYSYSKTITIPGSKAQKAAAKKDGNAQQVIIDDNGELNVVVSANAANWIDSQMDLLLPDCWKKTIKESGPTGKDRIAHLKNHQQDLDGVVGSVTSLYSKDIALTDLGIQMTGATQCLIMESIVKEKYDDKIFDLYSDKKIQQHSIGLQYVKLDLAINDPNSPAEFDIWNKYFAQVINKDVATKCGYFWVVYEIKLLEVSAVLWGSNELTGCIDNDDEEENDSYSGKSKEAKEPKKSISEMIAEMKIKL